MIDAFFSSLVKQTKASEASRDILQLLDLGIVDDGLRIGATYSVPVCGVGNCVSQIAPALRREKSTRSASNSRGKMGN
jgi:hypothetical protein